MDDIKANIDNQSDLIINSKTVVQPLVSIVVATYRRDNALEKALLSLAIQTYESIEIIVIDDNAADTWNIKVKSIIDIFETKINKQIIYFQNKVNKGSAETRNIGIRIATGEYITFLDDDDLYLPNKIKNQIEHMILKKSDFSITDLYLYDENDLLVEKRNRKYITKNDKVSLLKYHIMYHMTGTDTMMFKKDYLLKIGGFLPIDVGDEFYLMQVAIEYGGRFSYLPVCDVKAYVHRGSNGLSSGQSKIYGESELYEHKKKFFRSMDAQEIKYIKMRHYAVLAYAYLRSKNYHKTLVNMFLSFFASPFKCIHLVYSYLKG